MATPVTRTRTVLCEINVTPFVDVMLVLLIIFMVTAPLLREGVDVELPREKAAAIKPGERQVVTIAKNGWIYFNQRRLTLEELHLTLRQRFQGAGGRELFLEADREVPYGLVAKAMAVIKGAGVERLGMVTQPVE